MINRASVGLFVVTALAAVTTTLAVVIMRVEAEFFFSLIGLVRLDPTAS